MYVDTHASSLRILDNDDDSIEANPCSQESRFEWTDVQPHVWIACSIYIRCPCLLSVCITLYVEVEINEQIFRQQLMLENRLSPLFVCEQIEAGVSEL